MRNNKVAILSSLFGVTSLGVAVFAMEPSAWVHRLNSWKTLFLEAFSSLAVNLGWIILGASIALIIISIAKIGTGSRSKIGIEQAKVPWPSSGKNIISQDRFEKIYADIFENEEIIEVCIMGYTSETMSNYVKFKHRYQASVRFRILNRSWYAEEVDEAAFNTPRDDIGIRPWDKSKSLKAEINRPWNYTTERLVRYYDFMHPIIKAIILKSRSNSYVFLSFYECKMVAEEGGSPFKGDNKTMISLSSIDDDEAQIIRYLESQFEFIWRYRSMNQDYISRKPYRSYFAENLSNGKHEV